MRFYLGIRLIFKIVLPECDESTATLRRYHRLVCSFDRFFLVRSFQKMKIVIELCMIHSEMSTTHGHYGRVCVCARLCVLPFN